MTNSVSLADKYFIVHFSVLMVSVFMDPYLITSMMSRAYYTRFHTRYNQGKKQNCDQISQCFHSINFYANIHRQQGICVKYIKQIIEYFQVSAICFSIVFQRKSLATKKKTRQNTCTLFRKTKNALKLMNGHNTRQLIH